MDGEVVAPRAELVGRGGPLARPADTPVARRIRAERRPRLELPRLAEGDGDRPLSRRRARRARGPRRAGAACRRPRSGTAARRVRWGAARSVPASGPRERPARARMPGADGLLHATGARRRRGPGPVSQHAADGGGQPIELTYLNGLDVAALAPSDASILAAVEEGLRAQGGGQAVIEPRVHLRADPSADGHFNVLRGSIPGIGLAGVKVVGDFVDNYRIGLPSEMALLCLFDPTTGMPKAIVDATAITEMRTGAITAIGARHLARSD